MKGRFGDSEESIRNGKGRLGLGSVSRLMGCCGPGLDRIVYVEV